jgi:ATP-dependent DNA ligase
MRRPSGFIAPCLPSRAERPPSGPLWVHEIKHDGYRVMVRRDGQRIHCYTKNGHDWADRFPSIVEAARSMTNTTCLDGEAGILNEDGTSDFQALRGRGRGSEVVLVAFDLLENYGHDPREQPLSDRKRRLKALLGRAKKWRAIQYGQHLTGEGPTVSSTSARWALKASCRSGSIVPIALGRRRLG